MIHYVLIILLVELEELLLLAWTVTRGVLLFIAGTVEIRV